MTFSKMIAFSRVLSASSEVITCILVAIWRHCRMSSLAETVAKSIVLFTKFLGGRITSATWQ